MSSFPHLQTSELAKSGRAGCKTSSPRRFSFLALYRSQGRLEAVNGELAIHKVQPTDSGMYQCVAENKYGAVYSSAELKILGKFTRCLIRGGVLSGWQSGCHRAPVRGIFIVFTPDPVKKRDQIIHVAFNLNTRFDRSPANTGHQK